MAEGYVGEIRLFAGNYAPANWLICDGKLVPISFYPPLYSLIGITYGGDGTSTFALPDLRGRLPLGQGPGPGLTPRTLGQNGGEESVPFTLTQVPSHTHQVMASADPAATNLPGITSLLAATASGDVFYVPSAVKGTVNPLDAHAISNTGAAAPAPHANLMPCMALTFIICMNGLWPPQS